MVGGSGTTYEEFLSGGKKPGFQALLGELGATGGVVYNHPGAGESSWWATRDGMRDAASIALDYTQMRAGRDGKVVVIGFSIGGGVTADMIALRQAQGKPLPARCFYDRSFPTFADAVAASTNSVALGYLAIVLGWNMNPKSHLQHPDTPAASVLQAATDKVEYCSPIPSRAHVRADGFLTLPASLAHDLVADPASPHAVLGIHDTHDYGWQSPATLARVILNSLPQKETP